jgi:hypothetical protein
MNRRTTLALTCALAATALAGCAEGRSVGPRAQAVVSVAALAPDVVRLLTLEVTGPGIPEPLLANFPVDTTVTPARASGSLSVPAGSNRRLLLEARDVGGTVTHRADTTLTLAPGEHQLSLQMRAVESVLGITVTFPGG